MWYRNSRWKDWLARALKVTALRFVWGSECARWLPANCQGTAVRVWFHLTVRLWQARSAHGFLFHPHKPTYYWYCLNMVSHCGCVWQRKTSQVELFSWTNQIFTSSKWLSFSSSAHHIRNPWLPIAWGMRESAWPRAERQTSSWKKKNAMLNRFPSCFPVFPSFNWVKYSK